MHCIFEKLHKKWYDTSEEAILISDKGLKISEKLNFNRITRSNSSLGIGQKTRMERLIKNSKMLAEDYELQNMDHHSK